jgi:hypothetical protein
MRGAEAMDRTRELEALARPRTHARPPPPAPPTINTHVRIRTCAQRDTQTHAHDHNPRTLARAPCTSAHTRARKGHYIPLVAVGKRALIRAAVVPKC